MNIFEQLREDHQKQRTLVDLLCKTHGETKGRKELFARLRSAVEQHAVAEERHFYVPMLRDDMSQDKARHSIAEHSELNELFDELEQTDLSSPHWIATARKLNERLHHHLDEEEQEVFQIAGKVLSSSQKTDLAQRYVDEMAQA